MINRVLIRMKVVQLLYSYLLVEKRFMLESQPSAPTKEKRFAYNLYLDLLYLMTQIADNIVKRGGERPLADTRFIRKLLADDKIKSLKSKYSDGSFPFAGQIQPLTEIVKQSNIYKNYLKNLGSNDLPDDSVWAMIFDHLIITNPELNAVISRCENFSLSGVDRMRHLMSDTFTNFFASRDNLSDAIATLQKSLGMSRELYMSLLALPIAITRLKELQLDENRHKYITSFEDLNPNLRFVENELVATLNSDPVLAKWMADNPAIWGPDDMQIVKALLRAIEESDIYKDYMNFPVTDFVTDCEFWRNIFKHIIFSNRDFLEYMEDKSVFWNDDLDIIGTFLLKSLKRFEDGKRESAILPMYKDEEDARFGAELFTAVIRNKDAYKGMVDEYVNSSTWDADRLAFMDVIIIMTALAEILNFPKIPITVSVNEYIEIAKSYSTSKSGTFVHGILGAIINGLRMNGTLHKTE